MFIRRIIKRVLSRLCLSAHDVATSKQHKSISASDVLKALEIIEFGDLNDMLQNELQSTLSYIFLTFLRAFIDFGLVGSLSQQHEDRQGEEGTRGEGGCNCERERQGERGRSQC